MKERRCVIAALAAFGVICTIVYILVQRADVPEAVTDDKDEELEDCVII